MEFILRRFLVFGFLVLIGFACDSNSEKTSSNTNHNFVRTEDDSLKTKDTFNFNSEKENPFFQTEFYPILDVKDSNIVNTTNRKVDILFNGIDNFTEGSHKRHIRFSTECILCLNVEKFDNNLLFGKRLFITNDKVIYLTKDTILPKGNVIKFKKSDYDRYEKNQLQQTKIKFSQGKGLIKFLRMSCQDADAESIKLTFKDGYIEIRNLINIKFLEFDMDGDNIKEQYLFGARNCSQELAIFRINDISE